MTTRTCVYTYILTIFVGNRQKNFRVSSVHVIWILHMKTNKHEVCKVDDRNINKYKSHLIVVQLLTHTEIVTFFDLM